MYQKHLKLQKMICLLCVITAAITFIYSLGMMTDLYDALYSSLAVQVRGEKIVESVSGARIYLDMQAFNRAFVKAAIALILISCALFVTNSHIRRKYYISNYLVIGAYSVATIGVGLWAHGQIEAFAAQYMQTIDFEKLKEYSELWETPYLDNTNMLDLHRWVLAVAIVSVAALIGSMVWKLILVRKENALIETGKEAA